MKPKLMASMVPQDSLKKVTDIPMKSDETSTGPEENKNDSVEEEDSKIDEKIACFLMNTEDRYQSYQLQFVEDESGSFAITLTRISSESFEEVSKPVVYWLD